jgi:hypothetical protein
VVAIGARRVHALLMLTLLLLVLVHVRAAMCVERHTLIPTTAADTPMTTAGTRAQARLDLCDTAGVCVRAMSRAGGGAQYPLWTSTSVKCQLLCAVYHCMHMHMHRESCMMTHKLFAFLSQCMQLSTRDS